MPNQLVIIACLICLVPVDQCVHAQQPVAPLMLRLDLPNTTTLPLRILAEIDGNAATFTTQEKRKHAVLEQVMGLTLMAEPHRPTRPSSQLGS